METIVFEIELFDGRIFRIHCANSKQKAAVVASYYESGHAIKAIRTLTTGLHTTKQWLEISKTI